MSPLSLRSPLSAIGARVHVWSVQSHRVARRNAMVAATALIDRRRDREDVEDDLAAPAEPPSRSSGSRG